VGVGRTSPRGLKRSLGRTSSPVQSHCKKYTPHQKELKNKGRRKLKIEHQIKLRVGYILL